jgi:outer membrane usher protein
MIKEMELPAGNHNLSEFPFVNGPNDLRIEITDDMGRFETVNLSYFSNSELLAPGVQQLSYAIGAPSTSVGPSKTYNSSDLAISAFHRMGMNDWVTLGANLQGSNSMQMVGAETVFSIPIGAIRFESAASRRVTDNSSGLAGRAKYVYLDFNGTERSQRSLGLAWEARSPGFSSFADSVAANLIRHDLSALYSQTVSDKATVNLGFGYQIARITEQSRENGYRASASLNHTWTGGISSNVNFQQTKNMLGVSEASVAFFLSWNLAKERQSVSASYNMKDDSSRIDWGYTPAVQVGGTSARIGAKKQREERGFQGQLQHTADRGFVAISDDTSWQGEQKSPTSMVSLNAPIIPV